MMVMKKLTIKGHCSFYFFYYHEFINKIVTGEESFIYEVYQRVCVKYYHQAYFPFYSYRLHSQVGGGAIVGVGSRSLGSLYEGSAFLGSSPNNIDNGYSSHRDHNQKPRVTSFMHYNLKSTILSFDIIK